jgi:hypothetical protein
MEETSEEEFSASTTNISKSVIIKRHQLLSKKHQQHRLFSTSSKECSTGDNIIKTEESDP